MFILCIILTILGIVNDWLDFTHVGVKSDNAKANLMMNFICKKYAEDSAKKNAWY